MIFTWYLHSLYTVKTFTGYAADISKVIFICMFKDQNLAENLKNLAENLRKN